MTGIDNSREHEAGFAAGLTLGLIAGAMGMFLLGTDKGARVKEKLLSEWDAAQEYLKKQGLLTDDQEKNISQLLQLIKTRVIEEVGLHEPEPEKKSVKKRGYTRKRGPKQFRGV